MNNVEVISKLQELEDEGQCYFDCVKWMRQNYNYY